MHAVIFRFFFYFSA
ncbi:MULTISPECIES: pheST operon leader peptide PheM [Serratia]|nr:MULTISPECIES: pheST operon leader peptide PheM [Serratia]AYM93900.1 pheST operon leader peptide PheM [Serratia sp. 3ACOL1]MBJ7893760.1 pheST operon leader peptide PheM [Serratia sp. PAMC26656]MBL5828374.1 pheST operon leader peptide PheM [Serratia fonticola]MBL5859730.1 pheST operon leader peptide PheM [Serratia fonticola]MBL5902340.1 pheST operon leader peptide PheM [Serratia fonticola]